MRKNVTAIILASATVLASVAGASALDRKSPTQAEAKSPSAASAKSGASTGTTGQSTTGAATPSPENAAEDRLRKIMQICRC